MKIKVKVQIESNSSNKTTTTQIACFSRDELTPETLGLTLAEAKTLLANLQAKLVESQTAEYVENHRRCSHCGKTRPIKDHHQLVFRTLAGQAAIAKPSILHL